eukprot:4736319-Amphidinium_carterae.1
MTFHAGGTCAKGSPKVEVWLNMMVEAAGGAQASDCGGTSILRHRAAHVRPQCSTPCARHRTTTSPKDTLFAGPQIRQQYQICAILGSSASSLAGVVAHALMSRCRGDSPVQGGHRHAGRAGAKSGAQGWEQPSRGDRGGAAGSGGRPNARFGSAWWTCVDCGSRWERKKAEKMQAAADAPFENQVGWQRVEEEGDEEMVHVPQS